LRIVILHSDGKSAQTLQSFFKERGDQVWRTAALEHAEALIELVDPQLLFLDIHLSSESWLPFLNHIRQTYPYLKIIVTSQRPNLQREIFAQQQGVRVFLRHPYQQVWIERALKQLDQGETTQLRPAIKPPSAEDMHVRNPLHIQVILAYLVLWLFFSVLGTFILARVVKESVEDRFMTQLAASSMQNVNLAALKEENMLTTVRLAANLEGMAHAVEANNAEQVRDVVLPFWVNSGEEALDVINRQGISLFSARRDEQENFTFSQGETFFKRSAMVHDLLSGKVDEQGDNQAGIIQADEAAFFYLGSPVYDADGDVVGAVLVGQSLNNLAGNMRLNNLTEVMLYDPSGKPMSSNLESSPNLPNHQVKFILSEQDSNTLSRTVQISGQDYIELVVPWEVRNGTIIGLLGTAQVQSFVVSTSQSTRMQIALIFIVCITLVIWMGTWLGKKITRPLQKMISLLGAVSNGNLDVKVSLDGENEITRLGQSINTMVTRLQEGLIYRDLMGRSVSPEIRDQLHESFTSGDLHLAGQHLQASVLNTDIRMFTTITQQAEPEQVFEWLNEYFGMLVPIVTGQNGVVNKFDGDAMLAYFGILPRQLMQEESVVAACRAAVGILHAVERINWRRSQAGLVPLVTGIAVSTGEVVAGGLGNADRLHFTIIGEAVNTVQQLQGLTRELFKTTAILIDETVVQILSDKTSNEFIIEPLGHRQVVGRKEPLEVFRLLPILHEVGETGD
jgi:adenylate cyclase